MGERPLDVRLESTEGRVNPQGLGWSGGGGQGSPKTLHIPKKEMDLDQDLNLGGASEPFQDSDCQRDQCVVIPVSLCQHCASWKRPALALLRSQTMLGPLGF